MEEGVCEGMRVSVGGREGVHGEVWVVEGERGRGQVADKAGDRGASKADRGAGV